MKNQKTTDKPQVYILNKIFDGSWNDIEGNISHEIIDFVLTDDGKYFVYNVPYGTCPDWISVKGDQSDKKGSHEVEYLLLTSEAHNKSFKILYRIKLKRKVHNVKCSPNCKLKWKDDTHKNDIMQEVYKKNNICYGGKIISELIDNTTPLVTFEAVDIEKPEKPIEISLKYNYVRNKGYVKSDFKDKEDKNDYDVIDNSIKDKKISWSSVELNKLDKGQDKNYTSKTFLDLLLKNRSEDCYTNMLYSILHESDMIQRFCHSFAPGAVDMSESFSVKRECTIKNGRIDICAYNKHQHIVIENKLESGLNGIKNNANSGSRSQLSNYYDWAKEKETPICFITAPDYRIQQLSEEIRTYDTQMQDKYLLVSYGDISKFLEDNKENISMKYEYHRYLDDIIKAFKRHSYPTKIEYYRSLLKASLNSNQRYNMRKITMNEIETLSDAENQHIFDLVYNENNGDFHYLAFDRQLAGFSPLGTYISNYPAIQEKENEIIAELVNRKEVESLYPVAKLSLYPVTMIDGPQYSLDMANYEKHFADILELNDTVYKTKNLFVDFGHGAENFDEALVIQQLRELLSKSTILENIYLEH